MADYGLLNDVPESLLSGFFFVVEISGLCRIYCKECSGLDAGTA